MVARNDLIVLNQGKDFTFRRGTGWPIIDLKVAALRLASKIGEWCVLEVITSSAHRCIEFNLETQSPSRDDQAHYELGWFGPAGTLEDTVRSARRKVVAACDYSMRKFTHSTADAMLHEA